MLAAVLPGVAQASQPTTSITTPADPYYAIWNEQTATPNVTISGTSTGIVAGNKVDILCYHDNGSTGTSQATVATNVVVGSDGSFSTSVPLTTLDSGATGSPGSGECRLRAVAHSANPTTGLGFFSGPRTLVGYYFLNANPTEDYDIFAPELGAEVEYDSFGSCGIDNSYLNDPTTFGGVHDGAWGCNDWTRLVSESDSSLSGIEIDGEPAYAPADADDVNGSATGFPALVVSSVSESSTTGDLTIDETNPLAFCSGNAFPANSGNCSAFVSAGVSDHRIITQTDNGHTITISDSYSSTDGSTHEVNLRMENDQFLNPTDTAYEFPGQSSFAAGNSGEQVSVSAGATGTIYVENTNFSEPSTSAVRGAITYYQTPSGPFTFQTTANPYRFDALNSFTVPATGSVPIKYSYSEDYTLAAVQQEVAAAEDANDPPTAAITSPAPAATVTGSPVTVTGTAAAGSGVASVTVNGVTATLNGTSWTAAVALTPGENTITITVTSETGVTSTTTETVDYVPSTSATPGPTPTTGGEGLGLSTKAMEAGVSVSGTGGLVLPLVCPQTATGCDADGILTLALSGSSSHALYAHAAAPVRDSVLATFSGVQIQTGQSRLVSVKLTPAATRYLQTRGVRRVQVTLTIHNYLSGGTDVTTTQLVWLNIAALRASCPAAVGTLTASSVAQMRLGLTGRQAHRLGPHRKASFGFERYCLSGGAMRVAYTTRSLMQLNPGAPPPPPAPRDSAASLWCSPVTATMARTASGRG